MPETLDGCKDEWEHRTLRNISPNWSSGTCIDTCPRAPSPSVECKMKTVSDRGVQS